jgi:hypothetical protein
MVKKNDLKQNVKVKQKQNVNVKVHIDQRDTKKKPRKKRSNIPSAKREGVSSFSSSSFTPVYIQSGNPYPSYPQAPEIQPIKAPVSQEVHTLVNPPMTSTTNLIQEVKSSRSVSPLSLGEEKTPSFYESIGGRIHGRGIMHYEPSSSDDNFSLVSNPLRATNSPKVFRVPLNTEIMERSREINENKNMGKEDKRIPSTNNHSASLSIFPLNREIIERSREINEIRNMGNEDINVNVKKVPRVRRSKRDIEEDNRNKEMLKAQKQIDKEISKNERDLMKREDTRRKAQLKKERNERNAMGKNDINANNIRGL